MLLSASAQVKFRTIVPGHTIAPGESFQVQYILENANEISGFLPPQFQGFRIVSGPHVYSDGKSSFYRNLVFTLVATKQGRFKIYGATCLVNGKLIKSNDAFVKIGPVEEAGDSPYFLRLGEDPFKKISENLFLKLILNKQNCFIGEPLVATFKLYSRLQSRSNVVKNPGFYGFSVYDMINVNDQVESEEKLNGHWFQVHTVRRVQLYPLQAGSFTIDAMEVANEVEFSRSVVNKRTEQEVTENMYGNNGTKQAKDANSELYKMNIKTDPVIVHVKPLPAKSPADTFAGAVGNFSINAFIEKDSILKNEENSLTVVVKGSGNFQRVNAPAINWPQEFETFDVLVTDTLNKAWVPLTGQRSFKYVFVGDKPGWHTIPEISFSFFNLKSKTYKTVSTKPLTIFISSKSKTENKRIVSESRPKRSGNRFAWWLSATAALAMMLGIFLWLRNKRNAIQKLKEQDKTNEGSSSLRPIEEILRPAHLTLEGEDKIFFRELHQAIWNYLNIRLQLSGSQMNKELLSTILMSKNINRDLVEELIEIIRQSETGIYTSAHMNLNKQEFFQKTGKILEAIENSLV